MKKYIVTYTEEFEEDEDGLIGGYENLEEFFWENRVTLEDCNVKIIEE